jgi:hypothetical protein
VTPLRNVSSCRLGKAKSSIHRYMSSIYIRSIYILSLSLSLTHTHTHQHL